MMNSKLAAMNFKCLKCSGQMLCTSSRPTHQNNKPAIRRRRECKDCRFRITTLEVEFVLEKKAAVDPRKYWREYKRKRRLGAGSNGSENNGGGGAGVGKKAIAVNDGR